MKIIARSLLLLLALIGLISFIATTKARLVLSSTLVPSTSQFQKLQYCLIDSDCQVVNWHDCNQCQYARAVNNRWANYFYDNADYYQYPIGFNTFYCEALQNQHASTTTPVERKLPIACENQYQSEFVVGSGCDPLIKQCFARCRDSLGRVHKCSFDSYMQRLADWVVPQVIMTKHD